LSSVHATTTSCLDSPSLHDALRSVHEVRQPPSRIEDLQDLKQVASDNILARGTNDQGTAELAFSGRLTEAAALAMKFCQHASARSEEHTSELQSPDHLVCRLLLEK